jgi:hypothetical protein
MTVQSNLGVIFWVGLQMTALQFFQFIPFLVHYYLSVDVISRCSLCCLQKEFCVQCHANHVVFVISTLSTNMWRTNGVHEQPSPFFVQHSTGKCDVTHFTFNNSTTASSALSSALFPGTKQNKTRNTCLWPMVGGLFCFL